MLIYIKKHRKLYFQPPEIQGGAQKHRKLYFQPSENLGGAHALTINIMTQKNSKIALYICLFILITYITSKLSKSNSSEVEYTFVTADSVGSSGGDIPAIKELNRLVEKNYLKRNYYESNSFETTSWYRLYANYNTKHQALFIGDADGWSYFFYATPVELKMIADRGIPAYKLNQFLKPFPEEYLDEIPTRSRNYFSIF